MSATWKKHGKGAKPYKARPRCDADRSTLREVRSRERQQGKNEIREALEKIGEKDDLALDMPIGL